jgi:hypothetical protein
LYVGEYCLTLASLISLIIEKENDGDKANGALINVQKIDTVAETKDNQIYAPK